MNEMNMYIQTYIHIICIQIVRIKMFTWSIDSLNGCPSLGFFVGSP